MNLFLRTLILISLDFNLTRRSKKDKRQISQGFLILVCSTSNRWCFFKPRPYLLVLISNFISICNSFLSVRTHSNILHHQFVREKLSKSHLLTCLSRSKEVIATITGFRHTIFTILYLWIYTVSAFTPTSSSNFLHINNDIFLSTLIVHPVPIFSLFLQILCRFPSCIFTFSGLVYVIS